MSIPYRIIFSAIAATMLCSASCKKDPAKPSENTTTITGINLEFSALWDGASVVFNSGEYMKSDSETVKIANWAMILSNLSLVKTDGSKVKLGDGYLNVDFVNKRSKFTFETTPQGDYKAISFDLGVDSATNHADPAQWPATHPLNANFTGLHWSWAGGYIFHAFEGYFKAKNSSSWGAFTFHTATDMMLRSFTLPLNFSIDNSKRKTATIELTANKFFENPNLITLKNGAVSQSSGAGEISLMNKILENAPAVFKLAKVE